MSHRKYVVIYYQSWGDYELMDLLSNCFPLKFGVGGNPTSIRPPMPSQRVGSSDDPAESCDDHQGFATQLFRLNA